MSLDIFNKYLSPGYFEWFCLSNQIFIQSKDNKNKYTWNWLNKIKKYYLKINIFYLYKTSKKIIDKLE
jgi:hypothetical protein